MNRIMKIELLSKIINSSILRKSYAKSLSSTFRTVHYAIHEPDIVLDMLLELPHILPEERGAWVRDIKEYVFANKIKREDFSKYLKDLDSETIILVMEVLMVFTKKGYIQEDIRNIFMNGDIDLTDSDKEKKYFTNQKIARNLVLKNREIQLDKLEELGREAQYTPVEHIEEVKNGIQYILRENYHDMEIEKYANTLLKYIEEECTDKKDTTQHKNSFYEKKKSEKSNSRIKA